MSFIGSLIRQIVARWRVEALWLPVIVMPPVILCALAYLLKPTELDTLFRDTVSVAQSNGAPDLPLYAGAISNLGILLWAMAGGVCLFAAGFRADQLKRFDMTARFIAATGLISLVLMMDDLFLLHERWFPAYGLSEKKVFAVYALLIAVYGLCFLREIVQKHVIVFIAAYVLFAISLIADNFVPQNSPMARMLEDGTKFVAIFCWAGYSIAASVEGLRSATATGSYRIATRKAEAFSGRDTDHDTVSGDGPAEKCESGQYESGRRQDWASPDRSSPDLSSPERASPERASLTRSSSSAGSSSGPAPEASITRAESTGAESIAAE